MQVYVFTVCYEDEIEKFKNLALKKGAYVEAVVRIPFRNIWGQPVGTVLGGQWAIIYAHTEPLEMEVKT